MREIGQILFGLPEPPCALAILVATRSRTSPAAKPRIVVIGRMGVPPAGIHILLDTNVLLETLTKPLCFTAAQSFDPVHDSLIRLVVRLRGGGFVQYHQ